MSIPEMGHLRSRQAGKLARMLSMLLQSAWRRDQQSVCCAKQQVHSSNNNLGVRYSTAHTCQSIWDEYEAGDLAAPCHPEEPAPHPYEWEEFLLEQWTVLTRESERMKDDISDPSNRSDEKLYRGLSSRESTPLGWD
eukprot:TRINITY_DN18087_c0_g1_i4.p1 TRINITY_DN18087_c0_g1~~TRINITY_DN18087_c0_g1_i4.p1  ORF type:complete len:137 (+),score=25.53 TRINITY_DN18087_c0_g1_i4:310-720(+)